MGTTSAPHATYAPAMTIFEYIFNNPRKSMTEILVGTGVSSPDFDMCIDVLEDTELVRSGYVKCGKDASSEGRPDLPGIGYIYVYRLGKEMTLEDAQKVLREKLSD